MRVVIDTNILVSAFASRSGYPATALDFWIAGRYELVTSNWQIEEFRRVSRRERVKKRIDRAEVGTFVSALRRYATVMDELPEVDISPDPDDNFIIASAITGEAQYIVSGDKRGMLDLQKVQGIPIITARELVQLFVKSGQ